MVTRKEGANQSCNENDDLSPDFYPLRTNKQRTKEEGVLQSSVSVISGSRGKKSCFVKFKFFPLPLSPDAMSLLSPLSFFPYLFSFPVSRFLIPISPSGDMRQQRRRQPLTCLRSALTLMPKMNACWIAPCFFSPGRQS